MTVQLGKKIIVGDATVAAVTDSSLTCWHQDNRLMVFCQKRPVAILLCRGEARLAVSEEGKHLSQPELEAICPGAWQLFDSLPAT